jgi:hypothetical protein
VTESVTQRCSYIGTCWLLVWCARSVSNDRQGQKNVLPCPLRMTCSKSGTVKPVLSIECSKNSTDSTVLLFSLAVTRCVLFAKKPWQDWKNITFDDNRTVDVEIHKYSGTFPADELAGKKGCRHNRIFSLQYDLVFQWRCTCSGRNTVHALRSTSLKWYK